jgi:hypothetical protein
MCQHFVRHSVHACPYTITGLTASITSAGFSYSRGFVELSLGVPEATGGTENLLILRNQTRRWLHTDGKVTDRPTLRREPVPCLILHRSTQHEVYNPMAVIMHCPQNQSCLFSALFSFHL